MTSSLSLIPWIPSMREAPPPVAVRDSLGVLARRPYTPSRSFGESVHRPNCVVDLDAQWIDLIRLETGELHHLPPLLGFLGDQLGEVGSGAGKWFTTEIGRERVVFTSCFVS